MTDRDICQHCQLVCKTSDLKVCCTCYNDGEECIMCPQCTEDHKLANLEMDYNIQSYEDFKKMIQNDESDWRELFN